MKKKERVLVAMSGGVDSSVTAALLLERGYDVIGATMLLSEESREAAGGANGAAKDARRVAEDLGIAHCLFDFRSRFAENVIGYFLSEYARGRTPNPCVECNRTIKFGALFEKAMALGADFVATGHYARVLYDEKRGVYDLCRGLDEQKDQSYVLYHLGQEKLSRILLPLGDFSKPAVRDMAERYHLSVAHKAESQEICFIADDDHARFLREHRPACLVAGDIVDEEGRILGSHQGVPLYTIGQRKGLGIAAPEPLYVVRLDTERNRVVVGGANEVFEETLSADHVAWTAGAPRGSFRATAKIRYSRREGACTAHFGEDGILHISFDEPQRAVTPGQSVVLYDGARVLGGGIIRSGESDL